MNRLFKDNVIPFGSQYYRAPSPDPSEWERDLKTMADMGFNMVKFWVQWRWNHPAEDKFYFDDIDRLMELAHRHHLQVMLNTIFDVAPSWIYRKYDDASMLTLDGRRIGPQTQPHRQIGGLGYCLNHDAVMEHFYHFLTMTVRRFREHPALAIWNIGSEPELTSSMAELRLYADDAAKMGDMLCYCDHCIEKFKKWLQQKYQIISRLNLAWNRNYYSFSDIEVPKTRNTYNDMVDWRMFFVHILGENVKRRFDIAEREDAGRHPLMCHHVFIQGFPVTSTANDPWNVGRFGHLHGFTQMDDPMMIDILRSCAKDKPVISAEMLMLPGYTLDLPRVIDANDVKRFIFSGVAGNLKGFIFWQYRPEVLGREAPTWGLAHLDGSETPWLRAFAETGQVVQQYNDFLMNARPTRARVAILYLPENQIFVWTATGNEKNATDSLMGFHKALYDHNFNVDFIHPDEFESDILSAYDVICLPFPYWLSQKEIRILRNWVESGGTLIAESFCAAWDVENGRHYTTVPGGDLAQVFGARQSVVDRVADLVKVELTSDIPYCASGSTLYGSHVQATFFPGEAVPMAKYQNGDPAIVCGKFGKGTAVLFGTYLALPAIRHHLNENFDFLAGLVHSLTSIERPSVIGDFKIRVDVLRYEEKNEVMIIIRNLEAKAVQVGLILPIPNLTPLREVFTGAEVIPGTFGDRSLLNLQLSNKEVQVFHGKAMSC